jgi:hypothetical protein
LENFKQISRWAKFLAVAHNLYFWTSERRQKEFCFVLFLFRNITQEFVMYISNVRRLPDDRIVKINVYTQQPLAEVFFHMQMSYSRYANKNHDDKKYEFLREFTDEHSSTEIDDWKLNFWFYDKIISFDRLVHGDTCALPVLAGIDWASIWSFFKRWTFATK